MGREQTQPVCADAAVASASGVEEAIFHWDMQRDVWHWSDGAREVLQVGPQADINSGRAMLLMMDAAQAEARMEAIQTAMERGQREYALSYRFLPGGRGEERGFMVLEQGFWVPDAEGRPAHAFGTIRRLDCSGDTACLLPGMPERDPASGLYCRSYFFRRLERFLEEEAPKQRHAAVLLISLRNYSIIFDAYGFEAADATYSEVARRLSSVLRAGDIIARYGHSRIIMLLHDCAEDDLEPAMRRFIQTPMAQPVDTEPAPVWPMLAVGAVLLPQQAGSLTEAITAAEEALSEAEASPAGGAAIYSVKARKMSQRALKARFANEIFDALRQRRFTLAFQPIIRHDGTVMCHEALLRMFDDEGKPVPAAHLVPVAEELGLVRQVDMEVLELALHALRQQPEGCLAINVSAITVLAAEDFLQRLEEAAELVRGRLIVEITESAALGNAEQVNGFIDRLHALGCKVALDDFGAGYTSFRNLRDFHFDIVKLDGAFCENLSRNEQNQHFVRSLIELARNINIQIIAEWVEAEEDAALLREWGVDAMQGYLFGDPGANDMWQSPCLRPVQEETPVISAPQAQATDAPAAEAGAEAFPAHDGAGVQPVHDAEASHGTDVAAARPGETRVAMEGDERPPRAEEQLAAAPVKQPSLQGDVEQARVAEGDAAAVQARQAGDVRSLMRDVEADLRRLREMLAQMRHRPAEDAADEEASRPAEGREAAARHRA